MRLVLLAIPVALVVVGISALVRGLRGRRIDDHPLCRRCGFDLTGKPETSTRCPECGSDLTHPRAIRHGHRKRRPALIATGATLLMVMLLAVGAGLWAMAGKVNVEQMKPTWWLIREAGDKSPGAPIAAWTELNRR